MAFGFRKKHTPYTAIIDVHSGSVGVAITHSEPFMKGPELLFAYREYIKIAENPDTATLIRALRHALFSAALQFSQEGLKALRAYDAHGSIEKLTLICGAPWASTVTRFIHVEDKEPFTITKEKMGSLIAEAERRDETEMSGSELLKELNVRVVERAVINTTVNGYPVDDPLGKRGTELSLAHISGLVPQAIVDAAEEIQDKILPHASRIVHTFALVLYCVVRDFYPEVRNALIIDISGEATEIAVMQEGTLMETCVFPFGTHTFLRILSRQIGSFPDEALAHLRDYGDHTPENVKAAIDKTAEQYIQALNEAYTLLRERYALPHHIFLTTSKQLHSYFDSVIERASREHIGTHGTFVSLNTAMLKAQEGKYTTNDIFFYIEAHFFHKLHQCGEITA